MKLVMFERADSQAPVYFNPEHVVAITANQGKARIITNGVNGDDPVAYTVTVSPSEAASMLTST